MVNYEILCVDDEPMILEYMELLINDIGYKTVTFTDPVDAISYMEEHKKKVLLIVSDFKMGEMNGFDFRSQLLEKNIHTPFLILTGYASQDLAMEAMRLKIREFLEKPIVEDQFKDLVIKYAEESKSILSEEFEMISDFLNETMPMLDEIEDLILALELDSNDEKAINTYFRLLHTIKGTSSCLGLNELAEFSHKYEDLITQIKDKKIVANSDIITILLQGFDYLKLMYQCEQNQENFPHNVSEIVSIFDVKAINTESSESSSKQEDKVIATSQDSQSPNKAKEEKITISVDLLTQFLEMSGEITVLKNTIFKMLMKMTAKYPGDGDFEQLIVSINEMNKLTSLLQNQVSEMKKIKVDSVFRAMKRVVRDSARVCDKKVQLITQGEELRVDTSVGKLLNNILVHMLRNSVDHGIETPQKRLEIGKQEEGTVELSCYEEAENIVIEITDDGNGIDTDKIINKAIEKELYSEEQLSKMSKNRIFQILFESGFSTAEQVTAVSGRGVGMDMVKSSIEEFGGKIFIDSTLGVGSRFVITIPVPRSVLIIKSLMVYSLGQPFAVPLDDVEKVVLFEDISKTDMINDIEGEKLLRYHEKLIPLIDLRNVLNSEYKSFENIDEFNIVILKSEGFNYGIIVDQIEDIEEIVVKKLAHPLDKNATYQGVTFIGDGDIGMILNPKGIAASCGLQAEYEDDYIPAKEKLTMEFEYMQFHLSKFPNYCIPLDFVHRLEVFNVNDIEYSGDKPLVRYREGTLELMLLEQELELLDIDIPTFVKNREELDIIVVNYEGEKRGLIIHDLQDICKTFDKIDVKNKNHRYNCGTVFIDDKINTVIDLEQIIRDKIDQRIQTSKVETGKGLDFDYGDNFKKAS